MNIHGEIVLLRSIEAEDAEFLRSMINDPEMEAYVIGYSFPVSKAAQEEWIRSLSDRKNELRAIIDVNGEAIGAAMLTNIDFKNGTAEIHIKIAEKKNRKCGYGKDTISSLTEYAFDELRLNCIYCSIREDNMSSQRLFESCGYQYEGILRRRMFKSGRYFDLKSYSAIRD
jgi:diamine N-acetyltransferase